MTTALVDLLAEVGLGVGLQLLQDHRRDFLRAVPAVAHLDLDVAVLGAPDLVGHQLLVALHGRVVELAAHEALDGEDGVLRVGDRLPPREAADQPLAAGGDGDDRRRQPLALRVGDDGRLATFDGGHHRVGRPQVDTDCPCHVLLLRLLTSSSRARQVGDARQVCSHLPTCRLTRLTDSSSLPSPSPAAARSSPSR